LPATSAFTAYPEPHPHHFQEVSLSHTVVLGGGICGLAAGFTLAEHGERVTLLEAQEFLGSGGLDLRGVLQPLLGDG